LLAEPSRLFIRVVDVSGMAPFRVVHRRQDLLEAFFEVEYGPVTCQ
jgi:hypothetical protein